jgi:sodium pump decarboxylase gamma subunit
MNNALTISIIGAGMVFVGLILLWGMMDLLVRLTSREKTPKAPETVEPAEAPRQAGANTVQQQAAAAAVAATLALSAAARFTHEPQDKTALSPWQSTHRIRQINQANALPRRKND